MRYWLLILWVAGASTGAAATLASDGSQADVVSKIAAAATGDTVTIPAGSFTWGASASSVDVSKAITLQGAGIGSTTINVATSAGNYGNGTILITAGGTVKDFTIATSGSNPNTPFSVGSARNWRITNITYNEASGNEGYFAYCGGAYGLIDHCTINGGNTQSELIFVRGPSDSWQTNNSLGTADAVYVEDCTFTGAGYVCDANDNARMVIRHCTVVGNQKIDGHGYASNSTRGVRQMEAYSNTWTATSGFAAHMEFRGGTGMVFNNATANGDAWFFLTDYGYQSTWPNFGSVYQTPADYPIKDQIGVGKDPKAAASEPYYVWGNRQGGAYWYRTLHAVDAGAITQYGSSFSETDLIQADRDFYIEPTGTFDGSSGVGIGTLSAMNAITPSRTGVGFWVTAASQLYTWSGSAWVLRYTPYTYPHPLATVAGSSTFSGAGATSFSGVGSSTFSP